MSKSDTFSKLKKGLEKTIKEKYDMLISGKFFDSADKISDLAIADYDHKKYEDFKRGITPFLIRICEEFNKSR